MAYADTQTYAAHAARDVYRKHGFIAIVNNSVSIYAIIMIKINISETTMAIPMISNAHKC